jgi:hypothetical protein
VLVRLVLEDLTTSAPLTSTATAIPSSTKTHPTNATTWTEMATARPVNRCRDMPGLPGNRGLATLADAIT